MIKLINMVFKLKGDFSTLEKVPKKCPNCQFNKLYLQSDFNKNLGLTIIVVLSIITFILNFSGFNWFITWSPMIIGLVIDRAFNHKSPLVLVCYKCNHILRNLPKNEIIKYDEFDLEISDRIHYPQ